MLRALLFASAVLLVSLASEAKGQQIILLKLDDVIARRVGAKPVWDRWLKDVQAAGLIEFWMHGYHMKTASEPGEFEHGTAEEQRTILARGEKLAKEKLGFTLPVIKKWSPDWLLSKHAAPMYFENEWGMTKPEDNTQNNYDVHSPAWAVGFQKLALAAGATCHVKYPGHPTEGYDDIWNFIVKQLTSKTPAP